MQTKDPRRLSRLRQGVANSHEETGRLLATLLEREPMVRGTVYELRRKSGSRDVPAPRESRTPPSR